MAEVSIIGGGPAGCSAGIFLSKKGFKEIIIYEKSLNKRKACGGGLTWRTMNKYNFLLRGVKLNPIKSCHIDFDGAKLEFCFKKPIVYVSDRLKFDRNLREITKECGIKIIKKDVDINSIESNVIIDARGFVSSSNPAIAISSICKLKNVGLSFIFRKKMVRSGYFWIFPWNKKIANVGVGCLQKDLKTSIIEIFDRFTESLGARIIEKKIAPISLNGIDKNLGFGRKGKLILKVGESAGLINPATKEGIYCALRSGEIAAEALQLTNPLKKYNETIRKEFSMEFLLSKQLYGLLSSLPTQAKKNVLKFLLSVFNYYL